MIPDCCDCIGSETCQFIDSSSFSKIEIIIDRLRSTMHLFRIEGVSASASNEGLSLSFDALVLEQVGIATEIIRADQQNSEKLMCLQGSAGTGKTHTVRVLLSELHRLGIRCLVGTTTWIAAVQYPEGKLFILCFTSVSMNALINISHYMSGALLLMLLISYPLV
jgi:hypothetical protein